MKQLDNYLILVINPGGTSTKIALFEGDDLRVSDNIRHSEAVLKDFDTPMQQSEMRAKAVRRFLKQNDIDVSTLSAVVGRGGPIAPMPSGTYLVDDALLDTIEKGEVMVNHVSLLGAPLAAAIASDANAVAFIVDPVCVDEMIEEAKLSGLPGIRRKPLSHALSLKAVARAAAQKLCRPFEELNLITVHLGSGFSVAAQALGRQIDHNDATASGPMSPTRAGDLPTIDFAKMCLSQNLSVDEIEKLLVRNGGWKAHLGTDDIREIYERIDERSEEARLVIDATLLQLTKEIGGLYAVLNGEVDAVVITGGVARSDRFIDELKTRLSWFSGPIYVFTAESEMLALAKGAIRVLSGEAQANSIGPYLR